LDDAAERRFVTGDVIHIIVVIGRPKGIAPLTSSIMLILCLFNAALPVLLSVRERKP
jgi:hypothetical protein